MAKDPPDRTREQVLSWMGFGRRRSTHEQAEDHEGQCDDRSGPEKVEPERQRQFVALAEAVGMRRRASAFGKAPRGMVPSMQR